MPQECPANAVCQNLLTPGFREMQLLVESGIAFDQETGVERMHLNVMSEGSAWRA